MRIKRNDNFCNVYKFKSKNKGEIEEKIENFKGKYKDFAEMQKIEEDLKKILVDKEK